MLATSTHSDCHNARKLLLLLILYLPALFPCHVLTIPSSPSCPTVTPVTTIASPLLTSPGPTFSINTVVAYCIAYQPTSVHSLPHPLLFFGPVFINACLLSGLLLPCPNPLDKFAFTFWIFTSDSINSPWKNIRNFCQMSDTFLETYFMKLCSFTNFWHLC